MIEKIIILEGGFNEEHEISLNTSKEVQKSLKRLNYKFDLIKVNPINFKKKISIYKNLNVFFFNALHGPFGEDGKVQAILESNNLRFTHSNSFVSKIGFNKHKTCLKIRNSEIKFPEHIVLKKNQITKKKFINFFNKFNSFILKPVCSGSSFGIRIFQSFLDIEKFFLNYKSEIILYNYHNEIMLEKFIVGKELTVAVLEIKKKSKALAVTEIITNNLFYDYKSKYTKGLSKHILPAKLPKKIYNKCLNYAKTVHDTLGCKGVSRSDFIFNGEDIFFLEINTQPGLTKTSLVPEQLNYKNIDFDELIKEIIKSSNDQ